jgi:hypothetical protein
MKSKAITGQFYGGVHMSTRQQIFSISIFFALVFALNCKGGDIADNPQPPQESKNGYQGALVVRSQSELPDCDFKTKGQLFYIMEQSKFQYCDGSLYQNINLTGPTGLAGTAGLNGTDGLNALIVTTLEPQGTNCVDGGQKIKSGLDGNRNNTLDLTEVVATQYICNGISGQNGANGTNGLSGMVKVSPEPAGAMCQNGGQRIDSGLDLDSNNALTAGEINSTQYVCNGKDGVDGISILWKGALVAAPAGPQLNWAFYSTVDKKSYIWNGSTWQILAQDGVNGTNGTNGTNGISILWKGSLATAPAGPQLNWAYYNTTESKSYIWDGLAWQILAQNELSAASEINIRQSATSILSESGGFNFGDLTSGSSSGNISFIIENTGAGALSLIGWPPVSITGTNAAEFSVVQPALTSTAPGSSITFSMAFNPTSAGNKTAVITIPNNDSDEGTYTFSVEGNIQPVVLSVSPVNGSTDVPVNAVVTATFSEAMDPATLTTATFKVNDGTSDIPGTVDYAGNTATFTPSVALAENTVYTATLTTGVKDSSGNPMVTAKVWEFGTVINSVSTWDNNTEPLIAESAINSLTFSWMPITNAIKYRLTKVNAWGPPIDETIINDVTNNTITITNSTDLLTYNATFGCSWGNNYRICALNGSELIIECRHIYGYENTLISTYNTGVFLDNFDDSILNSVYHFHKERNSYTADTTQVSEAGGYLQLNGNETDNFPNMLIGYNPNGKRYVKISLKVFHHRSNEYYGGIVSISSYSNNRNSFRVSHDHNIYEGLYGTELHYYAYPDEQFANGATFEKKQFSSEELFDQWITQSINFDTQGGNVNVNINGTVYTQTQPYDFPGKILIEIVGAQWWTGQYMRIDDLVIESSDTPF